jgi:DNA-binding MarR family transcriptional regulator
MSSALPESELAGQLERTFRLLGKRIYRTGTRRTSDGGPDVDKASIPLLAILEDQGELRPSDIAAALELDQSTVSRQLHQLEKLGLVARRPDSGDGRVSHIRLTEAGRGSQAAARAARARMLDAVFAEWSEGDRRQLNTLLERLRNDLAALPNSQSPVRPAPPAQSMNGKSQP